MIKNIQKQIRVFRGENSIFVYDRKESRNKKVPYFGFTNIGLIIPGTKAEKDFLNFVKELDKIEDYGMAKSLAKQTKWNLDGSGKCLGFRHVVNFIEGEVRNVF